VNWVTKAWASLRQVLTPIWGAHPVPRGRTASQPVVREPYPGAWQRNEEIRVDSAVTYGAVYACTTRIAADIGKLRLRLVAQDADGIWTETESPAFSPVLRRPNRYQNIIKFVEQWIVSKLLHGNTYVLKERDQRGVVKALYILDPTRVTPLVAADGAVYYQLDRDELAGLVSPTGRVVVPASEIIHDLMVALFHPLCGVSPILACGLSALQGLKIQENATNFFANGAHPGSLLIAPGDLDPQDAADMKALWETAFTGANAGRVALLSGGVKFEPLKISAIESQLIEQLKWTAETVCSCFHVPPTMISVGPYPPYANSEPIVKQYYSQCLQTLIVSLEKCLDEGLELPPPYGTEFDIDDLIWMDTATRSKAASDAIGAGAMAPDEARKKYYGLGPVPGGDTPYMQQQYYALSALAARDADDPFANPAPPPPPAPAPDDLPRDAITAQAGALVQKAWAA
jgi:HK97 family phage portal protein